MLRSLTVVLIMRLSQRETKEEKISERRKLVLESTEKRQVKETYNRAEMESYYFGKTSLSLFTAPLRSCLLEIVVCNHQKELYKSALIALKAVRVTIEILNIIFFE